MKTRRDLLKHSSICMIGQILIRMASILTFPRTPHADAAVGVDLNQSPDSFQQAASRSVRI